MLSNITFSNFKSLQKADLPIEPLTLLVGANASGKSNALDGIQLLSRLATNRSISDILDGIRGQEPGMRGGSRGAPWMEEKSFMVGCTLQCGDYELKYEVEIEVEPHAWLRSESLNKISYLPGKEPRTDFLYRTKEAPPTSGDIWAEYNNRRQGGNKPNVSCLRQYSVLSQVPGRFPAETEAQKEVRDAAEKVTETLRQVMVLDPVPKVMKEYVHKSQTLLSPTAHNLSAVIGQLIADDQTKAVLLHWLQNLPEQSIHDLKVLSTPTDDYLLAVTEQFAHRSRDVDAKNMSDGTLRFIAILTALAGEPRGSTLVVEEIDNGLHPSRVVLLLDALRTLGQERGIDVIATTHNPALLNALRAEDMKGVVISYRDLEEGSTKLIPYIDLPKYPALVARGRIGDLITTGLLQRSLRESPNATEEGRRWLKETFQ